MAKKDGVKQIVKEVLCKYGRGICTWKAQIMIKSKTIYRKIVGRVVEKIRWDMLGIINNNCKSIIILLNGLTRRMSKEGVQ